jgi:hypothetical protein
MLAVAIDHFFSAGFFAAFGEEYPAAERKKVLNSGVSCCRFEAPAQIRTRFSLGVNYGEEDKKGPA